MTTKLHKLVTFLPASALARRCHSLTVPMTIKSFHFMLDMKINESSVEEQCCAVVRSGKNKLAS